MICKNCQKRETNKKYPETDWCTRCLSKQNDQEINKMLHRLLG